MPKLFLGLCLIAVSAACGGSDGPADAGVCVNMPSCNCNDGRRGRKVCDVDTHEFVMCECDPGSPVVSDAGTRPQGSAADGGGNATPGSGAAGRMSVPNRPSAAGSGDAGASTPDAGSSGRGNGKGHGRR